MYLKPGFFSGIIDGVGRGGGIRIICERYSESENLQIGWVMITEALSKSFRPMFPSISRGEFGNGEAKCLQLWEHAKVELIAGINVHTRGVRSYLLGQNGTRRKKKIQRRGGIVNLEDREKDEESPTGEEIRRHCTCPNEMKKAFQRRWSSSAIAEVSLAKNVKHECSRISSSLVLSTSDIEIFQRYLIDLVELQTIDVSFWVEDEMGEKEPESDSTKGQGQPVIPGLVGQGQEGETLSYEAT
ncbi:hypothetical protein DL96DRAFT_1688036 [Flagelloscypha sp. PMI_526]|nr:hypothetical protein DL96DRAFT_1688036 [Flagelloscypha sp. PMI_526]